MKQITEHRVYKLLKPGTKILNGQDEQEWPWGWEPAPYRAGEVYKVTKARRVRRFVKVYETEDK